MSIRRVSADCMRSRNYQDRFWLTAGAGSLLLSRNVALETRTLPFGSHIPLQPERKVSVAAWRACALPEAEEAERRSRPRAAPYLGPTWEEDQMADNSATAGFVMNQTMLRVRDPDISVAFYRDVLGMTELARYDFEEMQFSLYFMGYLADGEQIPEEVGERAEWLFARPALVELDPQLGHGVGCGVRWVSRR